MTKKLTFSPQAASDLEEIGDYIAKDSPRRAVSFLNDLEEHCNKIIHNPEAFVLREEFSPGVRMAIHGNYLILFTCNSEVVRIERIIHGSRKLKNLI